MHKAGDNRRSSLWESEAEPTLGAQSRAFYAQLASTTSVLDLKAADGQVRRWVDQPLWLGIFVTVLEAASRTMSPNVVPEQASTIHPVSQCIGSVYWVNDGTK